MALGNISGGADSEIFVGDSAPPATPVSGVTRWSAPRSRTQTIRKYYKPTAPKTIVGPSEDTWELTCDLTSGDDGQRAIIGHYQDKVEFYISVVDPDGNGKYQLVRASGDAPAGNNPDNPNEATYRFGGTADPVDIGSGLG